MELGCVLGMEEGWVEMDGALEGCVLGMEEGWAEIDGVEEGCVEGVDVGSWVSQTPSVIQAADQMPALSVGW